MKEWNWFYIFQGVLGILCALLQWLLFRSGFDFLRNPVWILMLLLEPLAYTLPNLAEKYMPLTLVHLCAWVGGYGFIFTYYATMAAVPFLLVEGVRWITGWNGLEGWISLYSRLALAALFILIIFGSWRAFHPQVVHLDLTTHKPVRGPVTFAFVSDIHFGILLGPWFARRLVRDLNRLHPDYILMGGDIIDGNLHVVEKNHTLEELRNLEPKKGTLAVLGNHDHYSGHTDREKEILEGLSIRVLLNEGFLTGEGIMVNGMGDFLYHPLSEVPPSDGHFSIVMEHEPVSMKEAAKAGHDLFLAGHTHGGQFWPNRYFTKRAFDLDYGVKRYGNMIAYVTSGYGMWGTPFRLGPKPEIVMITVSYLPNGQFHSSKSG